MSDITIVTEPAVAAPTIEFPWSEDRDPRFLRGREWLVTNGLGGYASGTLLGLPTRKYHGLFTPNLPAPRGRTLMIPHLEEELEAGNHTAALSAVEFSGGRVEGEPHKLLQDFRLEWQMPIWRFEAGGVGLEKSIAMPYAQNTVYVRYRLIRGSRARLELRPYVAFRGYEGPLSAPPDWPFTLIVTHGRIEIHPFEGAPVLRLAIHPKCCPFVVDEKTLGNVMYAEEKARGYDYLADLASPGYFLIELNEGEEVALAASTEVWEALRFDAATIFDAERRRREKLLFLAPEQSRTGAAAHLVLAADQFIILPGTRMEEQVLAQAAGDEARTVDAGYYWFGDWGRDTMISLEGLTLCTGRHREAGAILRTFAHYVHNGLIPNLFPEGERQALYHTVDATLWYFHAIDRYLQYTGDRATLELLFPVLQTCIQAYEQGTEFDIHMEKDGLIHAAAEGYQLTWMDAKVRGWVVTPRRGKPVEIQALWYNALQLMAGWAEVLGQAPGPYAELAELVRSQFSSKFWFESGGYLYDVIDGPEGNDTKLRPNQVFSVSLRHSVLHQDLWRPVIEKVREKLLTPLGLRTLSPDDKDYHPVYEGDLWARDSAYHQGLIWPWLIGHFIDGWMRAYPGQKAEARAMLSEFDLRTAGIGTISEIHDAEPPYTPRGCIAQAWSVAEVLRCLQATADDGRQSSP